jgi:hypothetical protein
VVQEAKMLARDARVRDVQPVPWQDGECHENPTPTAGAKESGSLEWLLSCSSHIGFCLMESRPKGSFSILIRSDQALSAVIDAGRASAGGTPGHPGDADGGQWPSDNSVRRRNQPVSAGNWQRSSDFKRAQSKECSSDGQSEMTYDSHFSAPRLKLAGRSLNLSRTSAISTFVALLGFKVKSAFAASLSVFQSRS